MKDNLLRKGLVFGIIVLFIGVSIIPLTGSNVVVVAVTNNKATMDNHPPGNPWITGPERVRPGTHEWTFKAIDPDGDNVRYLFDWGDGTTSWTDYYSSGETAKAGHKWKKRGTFEIKVKAKDIYGYESEWSEPLEVSMPKNQAYSLFLFLLQKYFPRLYIGGVINHWMDKI